MRGLISSKVVLELLDEVETGLGYPVECGIMPASLDENATVSVSKMNPGNKWWLIVPERETIESINDATYAHELLHIKLRLEGFPDCSRNPTIPLHLQDAAKIVVDGIASAVDHIEIEPRLRDMGLLDPNDHLVWIVKELLPQIEARQLRISRTLLNAYGLEAATTLGLFSRLAKLYPSGSMPLALQTIADHMRPAPKMAQAFEKTRQMLSLFGDPLRISRKDYHSKLSACFSLIEFPQEFLLLSPA